MNAGGPGYRVHVDPDKCQGHNRCYALAPDLFDVDDMGFASERGDGTVADDQLEAARRAVANCPEYAITLTETGTLTGAGPEADR